MSIAQELQQAIKNNQIVLFLQPKFSLTERTVIGAEALARWKLEEGGYRMPLDFIPALEESGDIVELDFCIYRQTLQTIKGWQDAGKQPVPVSVNFSRLHSMKDDFVERVTNLTAEYGINSNLIEVEMTETAFSGDIPKLFEQMQQLREAGFHIAIDDFGTGYSSLSVLDEAPADIVKIDKIFLKDIADSGRDQDYLKQICKLVRTAGKDIIFEGVETEAQAAFLIRNGYDKGQGYLFSPPVAAEAFSNRYMVQAAQVPAQPERNFQVHSQQELIDQLMHCVNAGLAVFAISDRMEALYLNPGYYKLFGYTEAEYEGFQRDITQHVHLSDLRSMKRDFEYGEMTKNMFDHSYRFYNKDGQVRWIQMRVNFMGYQGTIPVFGAVMLDITDRKRREQYLIQQSESDPMTRLLNKAATQQAVEDFLRQAHRGTHGMLIVDVDNFKQVNDTLGHLSGDEVIKNIAHCMKSVFRNTDIVGRVGGDEFLVFMKHVTRDVCYRKAVEFGTLVGQSLEKAAGGVEVSCSIGIAYYDVDFEENDTGDGRTYNELFTRADMAMYRAKKQGKNCVVAYSD